MYFVRAIVLWMIYCNLHPFFTKPIYWFSQRARTHQPTVCLLQSNMVVFWSIHYQRNSNFQHKLNLILKYSVIISFSSVRDVHSTEMCILSGKCPFSCMSLSSSVLAGEALSHSWLLRWWEIFQPCRQADPGWDWFQRWTILDIFLTFLSVIQSSMQW